MRKKEGRYSREISVVSKTLGVDLERRKGKETKPGKKGRKKERKRKQQVANDYRPTLHNKSNE